MSLFSEDVIEARRDYKAPTFCSLPCFGNHCLVVISHVLEAATWDTVNDDLVRWYIEDYWGSLEEENTPLFLIFLKVHYKEEKPGWWRSWFGHGQDHNRSIIGGLEGLQESLNKGCPFKVIEELTPVNEKQVRDWVDAHLRDLAGREWELAAVIGEMFQEGQQQETSRPMAIIERHLEIIHARCLQGY